MLECREPDLTPVRDLESREDIDRLLRRFYAHAMVDPVIGYLFTDVARLDLERHLPVIGDFWEKVLLQRPVYAGNPLAVHVVLHRAATLTHAHFQRWLELWARSVDHLFVGTMAEQAKQRAVVIAASMQHRLGIDAGDAAPDVER
jgi:hemoglobin